MMMPGSKGQKAVHACMIRLLNLGPAKHEKVAIYVVNQQISNVGLLYEDAEHHNCVFVGKNSAGQAKYAGLRGTYDRDGKGFRGDVTGSDKRVGFALPYDRSSDQVFVFEAPIDLMSYLTLHRNTPNALALCGLYDGALQAYLA